MSTCHGARVGLVLGLLALVVAACGSGGGPTTAQATPTPVPVPGMTPALAGTATLPSAPTDARRVKPGETCELRLPGNPTTGYSWEVVSIDEKVARLVSTDYVQENSEGTPVVGAGGVFVFHFQGVATGKTSVKLVYRRPWEKDVAPANSHVLDIMVQ